MVRIQNSRNACPDLATQLRHVQQAIVALAKRAGAEGLDPVRRVAADLH